VAEPTLYLFDGHNLFYAGGFEDLRELVDTLASFVALRGARGVVVFDGAGDDAVFGALEVRFAPHADALLERLADEYRRSEEVLLVSSDAAVRGTSGFEVGVRSSATFLGDLEPVRHAEERPSRLADQLDPEVRARLERLRRGGTNDTNLS
jgi:predicted RNA-binding protein with PIN domain